MRMQQMNTKTTISTQLPIPRKRKSVTSRALFAPKKMIKISLAETFSSMSEYQVLYTKKYDINMLSTILFKQ